MRPLALCLALFAIPPAAMAQTPLTADEFDTLTVGRTLQYSLGGTAYGIERYKADRRVIWSFLDGECREGRWYQDGSRICFVYEGPMVPQCWTFYAQGGGLLAEFVSSDRGLETYEAIETGADLLCHGPQIGV